MAAWIENAVTNKRVPVRDPFIWRVGWMQGEFDDADDDGRYDWVRFAGW